MQLEKLQDQKPECHLEWPYRAEQSNIIITSRMGTGQGAEYYRAEQYNYYKLYIGTGQGRALGSITIDGTNAGHMHTW